MPKVGKKSGVSATQFLLKGRAQVLLFRQIAIHVFAMVEIEGKEIVDLSQRQSGEVLADFLWRGPIVKRLNDRVEGDTGARNPERSLGCPIQQIRTSFIKVHTNILAGV